MIVDDFMRGIVTFAAPNLSDGAKMVWDWQLVESDLPVTLSLDGEAIVDAILARYYTPVQGALSNQLVITQVELRSYTHPSDGYIAAGTLWTGGNPGSLMPPANTMAIQLIRTDFTMRNGRKAYPGGVAGSVSTTGGVLAATVASFRTVSDGWGSTPMTVEFDEGGATFGEVVIAAPISYDLPVLKYQPIFEYSDVYWGTQNSRK